MCGGQADAEAVWIVVEADRLVGRALAGVVDVVVELFGLVVGDVLSVE